MWQILLPSTSTTRRLNRSMTATDKDWSLPTRISIWCEETTTCTVLDCFILFPRGFHNIPHLNHPEAVRYRHVIAVKQVFGDLVKKRECKRCWPVRCLTLDMSSILVSKLGERSIIRTWPWRKLEWRMVTPSGLLVTLSQSRIPWDPMDFRSF